MNMADAVGNKDAKNYYFKKDRRIVEEKKRRV